MTADQQKQSIYLKNNYSNQSNTPLQAHKKRVRNYHSYLNAIHFLTIVSRQLTRNFSINNALQTDSHIRRQNWMTTSHHMQTSTQHAHLYVSSYRTWRTKGKHDYTLSPSWPGVSDVFDRPAKAQSWGIWRENGAQRNSKLSTFKGQDLKEMKR